MNTDRRHLLAAGAAILTLPRLARAADAPRVFEPRVGDWRSFELTLKVEIADPQGTSRVWLPLPDIATDFQRTLAHSWSGNASVARLVSDPARDTQMLYAEFSEAVQAPSLSLTSRVQTRGRAVDWSRPRPAREDTEVLRKALAPTALIPLDGIVLQTARQATQGAQGEVAKVRAIYDWVVQRAHREPKVRGCGSGDIKTMLETGNLAGKCADLNAVFVGMCRSLGIPARDLYGLRLAPSAFGYKELGANPANLKGAQHCRAEVFLQQHGWVAMDPADVLKVMRQESPEWIKDSGHPLAAPVAKALFGSWEGNWVAYNRAHDLRLPGQRGDETLPFLMYPQGENRSGRFDELAPDSFRYSIAAREV